MDESTPFPGTAALVPVLGTALLVAAGARLPAGVVSGALSAPVPRYVGRISYAWYLWHWPVLVLATARWGEVTIAEDGGAISRASWAVVTAAVALSFGLAVLSHHLVEQPIRRADFLTVSRRRSLTAGGLLVTTSLTASLALVASTTTADDQGAVVAPAAEADVLPPTEDATEAAQGEPSPTSARPTRDAAALREPNTPEEARANWPREVTAPCYVAYEPTTVPPVDQCRVGPAQGAERTIALVGDSHAAAWYPAFRRAAEEHGWTLYLFGKSACPVLDVEVRRAAGTSTYERCSTWRERLYDRLDTIDGLDAVVIGRWMAYRTSTVQPDGSRSTSSAVESVWRAGAERTFDRLRRVAPRVVVMEDVPWPNVDVPSCLSENRRNVEKCAFPRSDRDDLDAALVTAEEAAGPKLVEHVDLADVICPKATCQVVSSTGQIKYRDQHHLTAGYSATLWPVLATRLEAALR